MRRTYGGELMEENSWRRTPRVLWGHPQGNWEAFGAQKTCRRHPGDTEEAPRSRPGGTPETPRRHPETPKGHPEAPKSQPADQALLKPFCFTIQSGAGGNFA